MEVIPHLEQLHQRAAVRERFLAVVPEGLVGVQRIVAERVVAQQIKGMLVAQVPAVRRMLPVAGAAQGLLAVMRLQMVVMVGLASRLQ